MSDQALKEQRESATMVDKINLYSLMHSSISDCNMMLEYDIPELKERSGRVRWIIERTAYIRRNLSRQLEELALEIVRDVAARTPPELMPEIYHQHGDTLPFRIKEGGNCPLALFEFEDHFTFDRSVAEAAHAEGAFIVEEQDDHPCFEIFKPELTEQLLLDWRRAAHGEMTFATCCLYKVRERWFVMEVPGEGDNYEDEEIKALLDDDEVKLYEECLINEDD